MPDTGLFYLFEVCCSPTKLPGNAFPEVEFVRAQCHPCRNIFKATELPSLKAIDGGGAAITCPKCGARQAISGARFAEYMERFPSGNCDTYRANSGDAASLP